MTDDSGSLPIFASDPLSSVTYATQEILLVLSLGGVAVLHLGPWVALAVAVLLVVVVASYRQVVRAYPGGGGSYEVVARNLGRNPSLVVAGALLVDYVLTVAVSVAAGVDNVVSALPWLHEHRVALAVAVVVVLVAVNLRGARQSSRPFATVTYLFVAVLGFTVVVGLARVLLGDPPVAETAGYAVRAQQPDPTGIALALLLLRAFASGCTALTGVEAISNGVPAFREPKGRNAGRTLLIMGALAVSLVTGLSLLAMLSGVKVTEHPCDLVGFPGCESTAQPTVVAQVGAAVFGAGSFPFYAVQAGAALILLLAANTAFNGFPMLGALLAQRRYLPRQLHTRGDRLAHSNGIVVLGLLAVLLIALFEGSTTALIQLYIVGVFTSFTLSQLGMVRHWNWVLAQAEEPRERNRAHRARLINATGAALTGIVLLVVLATKFTHGAYLVVLAVPLVFLLMRAIHRHYREVRRELAAGREQPDPPAEVHAIVLVSTVHKPVLLALSIARASRPDTLTALTVDVDEGDTKLLRAEWRRHAIPVPLAVVESPYREITSPVVHHVRDILRRDPNDLVCVYIPEYVVGHWWEQFLHNQSALRLQWRLRFVPGAVVVRVPWQLGSAGGRGAAPAATE